MKTTDRSELIDGLLRIIALGSITVATLVAPNMLIALDKPLAKYLKHLDDAQRKREIAQAMSYIRYHKLIAGDYQHGIALTDKAKRRLKRRKIQTLTIERPSEWDEQWRIVFFDIPEKFKGRRDAFAAALRQLGFAVLQRSVFIHPFPCREEVAAITEYYKVTEFTTYIEASHLDNARPLQDFFDL